ncbi:ABC transporter permease [Simiduia aestuariiviva]|uniref:Putative ABC transport system permease protein n=1 Tax=Simiduia aestuariiviva TaxID=1510459 RepID=A0A839UP48_9GAMM|nr:FtsX-like permease family protein [Simiduia aestuariiviva]MBB3169533.1 putative ABC transport system permease protein [Simiduia aestuariiviva]
MNDFYLIYKNLTRKKLRLTLTVFSIFIAFTIFGAVSALKGSLDSGIEMSADNRLVTVNKINFTVSIPYAYVNKIRAMEGVKDVTHANWFGGYYQEPAVQIVSMAVDPTTYFDVYNELVVPDEQMQRWQSNQTGMLVGARLAKVYGWKVGDRVPISSNIFSQKTGGQTWDFTVDGIFDAEDAKVDTGYMVFHYKYFRETNSYGGDNVGWLVLTTTSSDLNEQVAKSIDEAFANSSAETETSTEKAFNKAFLEQIGNIGLIIFGVVFMAFFTILVVVGNTMVLAIRERTNEIAVLKTLGFTSARIFKMVLIESLLLAFIGGLLGLGAAKLIVAAMSDQLARFLPNIAVGTDVIIQALLYMALLGLITGIAPAINALRLNIVTAFSRG